MRIVRFYTGSDNQSHFEEIDVPLGNARSGRESELLAARGVIFRETEAGQEMDFHNAPRRQFVINLEGEFEIECGDGSKRRFGPGEIVLADDTTGQGHITRSMGRRRMLFVALPDDFDVDSLRG